MLRITAHWAPVGQPPRLMFVGSYSSKGFWCSQVNTGRFLPVLCPAGHEWADADHRVASRSGLCRQLVWEGEVSTAWSAEDAVLDAFFWLAVLHVCPVLTATVKLVIVLRPHCWSYLPPFPPFSQRCSLAQIPTYTGNQPCYHASHGLATINTTFG